MVVFNSMENPEVLIPIIAMFGFGLLVGLGALFIGPLLGPQDLTGVKVETYECGIVPTGSARDRISVKYYLVAILFLLFDLEAAFLIPVAIAWPEMTQLGLVALGFTGFFLIFFVLSIWYELKIKALEWERSL